MAIRLRSYTLKGLDVLPVDIEIEVSPGMPVFSIIGMAGTSVQEAKDRVRSALVSSGFHFPLTRKVVNLAPAELHKTGSHFDLPMALGFLMAGKELVAFDESTWAMGELGLSGELRAVKGLLPALLFARENGVKCVLLPLENRPEAQLVQGMDFLYFESFSEVVHYLKTGELPKQQEDAFERALFVGNKGMSFSQIRGQVAAKRALAIAAAGSSRSGAPLLALARLAAAGGLEDRGLVRGYSQWPGQGGLDCRHQSGGVAAGCRPCARGAGAM